MHAKNIKLTFCACRRASYPPLGDSGAATAGRDERRCSAHRWWPTKSRCCWVRKMRRPSTNCSLQRQSLVIKMIQRYTKYLREVVIETIIEIIIINISLVHTEWNTKFGRPSNFPLPHPAAAMIEFWKEALVSLVVMYQQPSRWNWIFIQLGLKGPCSVVVPKPGRFSSAFN